MTTRLSTLLALLASLILAQPDLALSFGSDGRSEVVLSNSRDVYFMQHRGFYNQTSVQLKIDCLEGTKSVRIGWLLRLTECINEFYLNTDDSWLEATHYQIFLNPATTRAGSTVSTVYYKKLPIKTFTCDPISSSIEIFKEKEPEVIKVKAISSDQESCDNSHFASQSRRKTVSETNATHGHSDSYQLNTIAKTWQDGAYSLILYTEPATLFTTNYSIRVKLSFEHNDGFLSASEWPFLPFFGAMCGIYSLFTLIWLIGMACCRRDLLQIHYWIAGVVLLGLMEKAAYLAEYDGINRTGSTDRVAMTTAYIISCVSGSVASMFIFAMSLGLGILKQQLSPDLPKVVAVGALNYFSTMADGMLRDLKGQEAHSYLPLVIINMFICFWMLKNYFASGVAIQARKNMSELSLYRPFNNTIILCAITSIIFTTWSLMQLRLADCIKEWKFEWLDTGFWHIAFTFFLFVVMILWRPSKKIQGSILTDKSDLEIKAAFVSLTA